jgi:hypothetical protein
MALFLTLANSGSLGSILTDLCPAILNAGAGGVTKTFLRRRGIEVFVQDFRAARMA